jgi:ATP-dependent helicase YprA (DUF1998 family)
MRFALPATYAPLSNRTASATLGSDGGHPSPLMESAAEFRHFYTTHDRSPRGRHVAHRRAPSRSRRKSRQSAAYDRQLP